MHARRQARGDPHQQREIYLLHVISGVSQRLSHPLLILGGSLHQHFRLVFELTDQPTRYGKNANDPKRGNHSNNEIQKDMCDVA